MIRCLRKKLITPSVLLRGGGSIGGRLGTLALIQYNVQFPLNPNVYLNFND